MNTYRFPSRYAGLAFLSFFTLLSRGLADDVSDPSSKQRAAAALEQAVKTDPTNSELWLHLGFAYRKLDHLDQAQAAFQKASALNPHEEDAFYMLGLIDEKKGQKADAIAAWKNYLSAETDPVKRSVAEKHIHQLEQ